MNRRFLTLGIFTLCTIVASPLSVAQVREEAPPIAGLDLSGSPQTVEAALHQMSDRAAIIFVGTVASVLRPQADGLGGGVVEIQFNVEQAVRGCSGSAYTLREWSGLWIANDTRFHVGQRLLLLLHAPSATGLSSPVDGMDGAIPLRASGVGLHSSDTGSASADTVADLRWIGAHLGRPVTYRPSKATPSAMSKSAQTSLTTSVAAEQAPSSSGEASRPAQEANVSTIIGMLRSWEVVHVATR